MTDEILKKFRNEYQKITKGAEIETKNYSRYLELLQNPLIQEFVKLQNDYHDYNPISEEAKIDMAKPIKISPNQSSQIYVYYGTYCTNNWTYHNESEYLVQPDSPQSTLNRYRDLETQEFVDIKRINVPAFEKEHIIILTPQEKFENTTYFYNTRFYKLRKYFFKLLLTKSLKKSIEYITTPTTIEAILGDNISLKVSKKNDK